MKLNLLFKLSNLNSDFELTLGYLNPALNNPAMMSLSFFLQSFCAIWALIIWSERLSATKTKLCTYQCKAGGGLGGGGGRAWGGDLIVFVGPGVGHLTDLVVLGEGIFESFFARRGDVWLPTRTKKTEHNYVSRFHASRMRRMVWKDQEVMETNEN